MSLRKRKQPKTSTVLLFAFIIFVFGIFIASYNYLVGKKEKVYSSMNLLLYEDETPDLINDDSNKVSNTESNESPSSLDIPPAEEKKKPSYSYIGTLEIKEINLKRGFLDVNSPYNNVERNVTVIKQSLYPDVERGNLILAAHSGNCSVCYFNKLYKLSLDTNAYIYYKNKKYTYKLVNIYNVEKTGEVEIKRDPTKNILTLITCTHNSDTEQTVYIFELIKKENK